MSQGGSLSALVIQTKMEAVCGMVKVLDAPEQEQNSTKPFFLMFNEEFSAYLTPAIIFSFEIPTL